MLLTFLTSQELTFLSELNLSYNELRHLSEFPYRIPSVSFLNLAGNGIQNIEGKFLKNDLDIFFGYI